MQDRGSEMENITERLRSMEDEIKRSNLYLTEILEAKNGQKQHFFEDIKAENVPELIKDSNPYIQAAQ